MAALLCEGSHGQVCSCADSALGSTQNEDRGAPKNSGSWREIGGRECDRVAGAKRSSPRSSVRLMGWGTGVRGLCPPPPQDLHQLPDMSQDSLRVRHILGNLALFIC